MANPNSHDLLVERQAFKICKEVQMSTCTSPTRDFNFLLSQRTTEGEKSGRSSAKQLIMLSVEEKGKEEFHIIVYTILHFLQLLATS